MSTFSYIDYQNIDIIICFTLTYKRELIKGINTDTVFVTVKYFLNVFANLSNEKLYQVKLLIRSNS